MSLSMTKPSFIGSLHCKNRSRVVNKPVSTQRSQIRKVATFSFRNPFISTTKSTESIIGESSEPAKPLLKASKLGKHSKSVLITTCVKNNQLNELILHQSKILSKRNKHSRDHHSSNLAIERESNAYISSCIVELVSQGKLEGVFELLKSASSLSISPFVCAIRCLIESQHTEELYRLFSLMRSKSILPPASVFGEVVRYFAILGQNDSIQSQRAHLFFNDLKTCYIPSSSCYQSIWEMIPSKQTLFSQNHDLILNEMREAGISPTEPMFMSLLSEISSHHYKLDAHSSSSKKIASSSPYSSRLIEIENDLKNTFGIYHSSSRNNHKQMLETSKPMLSVQLLQAWIRAVIHVRGHLDAFKLASQFAYVGRSSHPSSSCRHVSPYHSQFPRLESMATVAAMLPKSASISHQNLNSLVKAIPVSYSPYQPLIIELFKAKKYNAVVQAWNLLVQSHPADIAHISPSVYEAVILSSPSISVSELWAMANPKLKQEKKVLMAVIRRCDKPELAATLQQVLIYAQNCSTSSKSCEFIGSIDFYCAVVSSLTNSGMGSSSLQVLAEMAAKGIEAPKELVLDTLSNIQQLPTIDQLTPQIINIIASKYNNDQSIQSALGNLKLKVTS